MIQVTNISGGQIVCDLAGGKTLRINNKESQTINDIEVTPYLKTLESKGLMKMRTLVEEVKTKENKPVSSTKKNSNKLKEE